MVPPAVAATISTSALAMSLTRSILIVGAPCCLIRATSSRHQELFSAPISGLRPDRTEEGSTYKALTDTWKLPDCPDSGWVFRRWDGREALRLGLRILRNWAAGHVGLCRVC